MEPSTLNGEISKGVDNGNEKEFRLKKKLGDRGASEIKVWKMHNQKYQMQQGVTKKRERGRENREQLN